jgi:hypothetical protein
MWDRNYETKSLLDQFLLQYVSSMDFETNWFAPPLFELGSFIPNELSRSSTTLPKKNTTFA